MPSWVMTLGSIADTIAEHPHYYIQARCRKCREVKNIDIPALIEKVGRDFRLLNKRTRCRLTPGCDGWNVFGYSTGTWVHHLFTWDRDAYWLERDYRAEQKAYAERFRK